jgi:hypothetical protein
MRHRIARCSIVAAVAMLLCESAAFAQTTNQKDELVSTLSKLAESAARGYVAPIVSAFGANLNSGWVHSVPNPVRTSLDLEFGVVGMASFFSASSKSFNLAGSFNFNHDEADLLIPRNYTGAFRDSIISEIMKLPFTVTISGPTIVGPKTDSVRIAFSGGTVGVTYQGVSNSVGLDPVVLSTGVTGYLDSL